LILKSPKADPSHSKSEGFDLTTAALAESQISLELQLSLLTIKILIKFEPHRQTVHSNMGNTQHKGRKS
jgi:hypothetical protein